MEGTLYLYNPDKTVAGKFQNVSVLTETVLGGESYHFFSLSDGSVCARLKDSETKIAFDGRQIFFLGLKITGLNRSEIFDAMLLVK